MLVIWTVCQQIAFFHDLFIDKVTAISIDPTCAKVLQKNLMFKMSDEALIVAGEFANLVHGYLETLDFGQRHNSQWSLESATIFQKLRHYTGRQSTTLFGTRLGKKLDLNEVYKPHHVPSSRYASKSSIQGIPAEQNEIIVQGIAYNIGDWNAAITEFLEKFDPYHLQAAVQVMMVAANKLRKAAKGVIKLVESNYRMVLGLRPIRGTSEAEMVYWAIVKEHGTDLQAEVRIGLAHVASKAEDEMNQLEGMWERSKSQDETEQRLVGQRAPIGRDISADGDMCVDQY